jgi:GTP-binding protein Era
MSAPPPFRSGHAAILGRANVGKSTLLNRLVGHKLAIVSPVPQTTRHRILGVVHRPEAQVAFLDSPGFHKPHHRLGELLVETARQVSGSADVLLVVMDAAAGLGPGDRHVLGALDPPVAERTAVLVLNKIDQMNKGRLLPMIEQATGEWGFREVVPVSAETGENVDRLLEVVLGLLPEGPPLYPPDYLTDQGERRVAAEIIREKLLAQLRQEVPHAVAVVVEALEERPEGLVDVAATVLVERASQKKIVVGAKGSRLKSVGTAARKELELRWGRKVFLDLWVKVREDWRDRLTILRELGVYPGT